MFDKLGGFVGRRPGIVLLIWLAAALALALFTPPWEDRTQDDDVRFLPARCLSVQGFDLYQRAFPKDTFGSKVIFAFERPDGSLTERDLALVDGAVAAIEEIRQREPHLGVGSITSYRDALIGSRLLSEDGRCTLILVALETPFLAFKTTEAVDRLEAALQPLVAAHRQQAGPDEHSIRFVCTGHAGIGRDLNARIYSSLDATTVATFILVVVILLLLYRAPLLALVPLLTIGCSVWMAMRILALVTLLFDVQFVNITRIFVVVVLYGAGTDYCLFLISRYREELHNGHHPAEAMRLCIKRVGGALTASAGTVICGLGMMGFAEFAKLRYTGPAIALSLVVALFAALTLTPALLCLFKGWVFWPWREVRTEQTIPIQSWRHGKLSRFWPWVAARVAASPGRVWLVSVALLLPLAYLGYQTTPLFDITAELPESAPSKVGLDMIRGHFTAGETGPLTVLLQSDADWSGASGLATISRFTRELAGFAQVAEVRSLTQPLGRPQPAENEPSKSSNPFFKLLPKLASLFIQQGVRAHYVAALPEGNVTRIEVVFQKEPFAPESVAAFEQIRSYLEQAAAADPLLKGRFAVYGITSLTHDVAELHESDRFLVNTLTLVGILGILMVIVRKPMFAVYLLLSVLFSYYVAIGLTELLSYGWLESQVGRLDWKVPFFLFTILIAIGEDYNIFLMARVMEESRRHGLRTGTQLALARTGSTITSCGLIMAGTFATLTLCSLTTLVQLGLALTFGVLLDTFIVRPVLVPAFLLLMHDERPRQEVAASVEPEAA